MAIALAVLLVAGGCGSDDGATGGSSAAPTEVSSATAVSSATDDGTGSDATAPAGAAVIGVADTDLGSVLVDGDGTTLYVFDNDDVDTSACTEGCLDAWPPVLADEVEAADGVTADLGTFTREDGRVQATANGLPLYRFASDAGPGDTQGQGVGGVWWVADATGTAVTDGAADGSTEATYGDTSY